MNLTKMHKSIATILLLVACGLASPALAGSIAGPGMYASWVNGPWRNPSFFPIAVWWQAPGATGAYGAYSSQAAAAAGEKINIFLGISGELRGGLWPEYYGRDLGELEAIKANNLYLIGGIRTPYLQNTSVNSVASVLALATSIGAQANLIGYQAADEPACSPGRTLPDGYNFPPAMAKVPDVVAGINSFDPTRIVTYNQTAWMASPQNVKCVSTAITALQSTPVGSMDGYTAARAYVISGSDFAKSDFKSIPNDTLFFQGVQTQALIHFGRSNQPMWAWVESGGDNLGASEANNTMAASIASGSKIIVNTSGRSIFTPTWVGLAVTGTGIPAGARIAGIVNSTHAVMSAAAGATANEKVKIAGGVRDSDCVESVNLCVVNGNEYRATPVQVNAEVWMSLINGANGIGYFCHDETTAAFCLGATRGGAAAQAVQSNLAYVNATVLSYAPVLNSPTAGACSLQQENYATGARSTTTSCANGILTLATTNVAIPGMAMAKQYNGSTYLFMQSDRRSPYGAIFHMTLAGLSGKTARVVYDSNAHYDPAHSTVGSATALNAAGTFSDTLGAHGDDYEVKIYLIQ